MTTCDNHLTFSD